MLRPINKIAAEIMTLWRPTILTGIVPGYIRFSLPYVKAMLDIGDINGSYGLDPADDIVLRFLTNASGWRGDAARRIKAELNTHLENVK